MYIYQGQQLGKTGSGPSFYRTLQSLGTRFSKCCLQGASLKRTGYNITVAIEDRPSITRVIITGGGLLQLSSDSLDISLGEFTPVQ